MNIRKIIALALAALMLASVLCACGDTQPTASVNNNNNNNNNKPTGGVDSTTPTTESNKANYQVIVYDVNGKLATTGVVVFFMRDGQQVAMQTVNASGVAEKELEKGDYTVELRFTNTEISYYYETADLTLSKTKTQLTVHLCMEQSQEGTTVYVSGDDLFADEFTAYPLLTGNTYVTLQPGRNYFLFKPTESGEYQLYVKDGAFKTSYLGGEHFIQKEDVGGEAPNNGTALSLANGMISDEASFVIGVDNPGTEAVNIVLYAVRISDYIDTSIPVEIFQSTAALTPWTAPANVVVNKFDISRSTPYNLVLGDDGFYHLNSATGPLVVVFLGEKASDYMDVLVPYDVILKNSGVSAYFKDEEGNYIKREDYSSCLAKYIGAFDEATQQYTGGCIDRKTGLYPLTEDLKHIIQNHGASSGWWDVADERFIFDGIAVNEENAWLFMCGYLG